MITQLTGSGYGGRRYGSFAGREEVVVVPPVASEDTGGSYQRIRKQGRKVRRVEDAYREILLAKRALDRNPSDSVELQARFIEKTAVFRQNIDEIDDISSRIIAIIQAEQANKAIEETLSARSRQEIQERLADTIETDLLLLLMVV